VGVDLSEATAVEPTGEPGRYRAVLSNAWEIWGPMGGYVAAIALRAAGAESPFARPASLSCQYLSVAKFDEVELEVTTLRQARTALCQRVCMTQAGKPILDVTVWSVGEVEGLEHHEVDPPQVPDPEQVLTAEERWPDDPKPFAFWANVEGRPLTFFDEWPPTESAPPRWQQWLRMRPAATFADPWVDAARSVVLLDIQSWPSASPFHSWKQHSFIAPNLDLYCAFHQSGSDTEFLLADGYAPVAADGLIGFTAKLWSRDMRLVASGAGQLLCRDTSPRPSR
jgi:acyl-CoA thioesterase II